MLSLLPVKMAGYIFENEMPPPPTAIREFCCCVKKDGYATLLQTYGNDH